MWIYTHMHTHTHLKESALPQPQKNMMPFHAKDPLARGQPATVSRVSLAVYGASYLTEALALLLPQVPGHLAGLQALGEMNSENQSVNTGRKQSPKGKSPPVCTPRFSGPTFPSDFGKSNESAAHLNCVYHRNLRKSVTTEQGQKDIRFHTIEKGEPHGLEVTRRRSSYIPCQAQQGGYLLLFSKKYFLKVVVTDGVFSHQL